MVQWRGSQGPAGARAGGLRVAWQRGQLIPEGPPSLANLKQIKTSKMRKLEFFKSSVTLQKGNVCNPPVSLTQ